MSYPDQQAEAFLAWWGRQTDHTLMAMAFEAWADSKDLSEEHRRLIWDATEGAEPWPGPPAGYPEPVQ